MNFKDKDFELVEIENLRGHTDKVLRVAWNPAAGLAGVPAMIASCGTDKTIRIWEENPAAVSFQCKQELERKHTSTVQQCFWSVTGKLLATSTVDGDTCVWESVEETFQLADNFEKTIWIWKISSYTEVEAPSLLLTDTEDVKMVQWHPSLDILFSVGCDNTIKVWVSNSGSWTCLQTLGERDSKLKHTFQALAFNSSADKIVACSDDLTIMIWGADSEMMLNGEKNALWTHLCALSGYHDKAIFSVHWSSEGIICSGAADGAICLFVENEDSSVDKPKYRLLLKKENTHDGNVNSVQWCTTKTIWIWKISSYTEVEAPSLLLTDAEDVKMVQWHPSLDILFSVSCDNTIKVWVSNSGIWTCIQTLGERDSKLKHTFQALAFNSSADKIVACSDDLTIMIWGADSEMMLNGEKNALWTHLCALSGYHDKAIFSVHWSSEGIICSGAADGAICLFVENEDSSVDEPKYRLLLKKENTHDGNVNSVQWCTTEKRRLASASDDGTVKIWELASLP